MGTGIGSQLIHQVVDVPELDDAVSMVAENLRKNGPQALAEIKKFFDVIGESTSGDEIYEHTAKTISRIRGTEDAKEGFAAIFEKRAPSWML